MRDSGQLLFTVRMARAAWVIVTVALATAGCATSTGPGGPPTGSVPSSAPPTLPSTPPRAPTVAPPRAPTAPPPAPTATAPSSTDASVRTASTAGGPGSAQTSDERRAAIDRRLDDSLGTFDATLRKEQEHVAKERDARQAGAESASGEGASANQSSADAAARKAGSNSTEGTDQGTDKDSDKDSDRDSDRAKKEGDRRGRSDQRTARSGDLKSDKGNTTAGGSGGNGTLATKIPDGSDDDVVARRLRKAAEQETDPELKEKLWQEYIEYKKSAQG
jgi:hypothetical protein